MPLPARDSELVQILDASLAEVRHRAGSWLACRPGCTPCCHGAFLINALDAERLRAGMDALRVSDPELADEVRRRAHTWIEQHAANFPGDPGTGLVPGSPEQLNDFEDFSEDAPCPGLNPSTGRCDVYAWRPMTCRVFGPPVRVGEGDALGCCELCFVGATDTEIAACEMPVPHKLEEELMAEITATGHTVVAFALRC